MLYFLENVLEDWAILDVSLKNRKRMVGTVVATSEDSPWKIGEYSTGWASSSSRKLSKRETEKFHSLGYYSPMKLSVDFDKTLFITTASTFPEVTRRGWAHRIVAAYLRKKKKQGWIIILNTMREKGRGLEEALEACKKFNIPIDYVNENAKEDIAFWGDSRKIGCDLSIDDTQVGLIGFLLRNCK